MMDIEWESGSRTVRWGVHREVEKTFVRPPVSVVESADPPSVLVVEGLEDNTARPSNAIVFNENGTERLRLSAPKLPEASWQIGYYLAYVDVQHQLVAIYSTRVGDLWGRPDLRTGELRE